MREREETTRISRLIAGVLLVGVGGLLVLQELHLVFVGSLWRFWPLLLVWAGATRLFAAPGGERRVTGALFVVFGGVLLAEQLGWIEASLRDFWPVLLVALGVGMILEGLRPSRPAAPAAPAGPADPEIGR